jgi:RNA polymerase sigma factor (sigma-70 family)
MAERAHAPWLELPSNPRGNFSSPTGQLARGGDQRDTSAVTDADIIKESLLDAAAFAGLFDRHYRPLHRFLRGRIGPLFADDLASETFTIAFRRRGGYDLARADARPWLYGIAVNLLRDHRRSEERRLRAYARAADQLPEHEWPEERLNETVSSALLGLKQSDRNLILLHAWAQLSYEELAEALDLPLGTVRSRLNRTRSKLRAALTQPEAMLVGGGGKA